MFEITIVGSAIERMGDTVKNCLVHVIYLALPKMSRPYKCITSGPFCPWSASLRVLSISKAMETVEWQRLVMEQASAVVHVCGPFRASQLPWQGGGHGTTARFGTAVPRPNCICKMFFACDCG